jgi:hypothetical protein
MKKGVFSLMNFMLPKMGILSLHSGCNEGKDGDVTLFFGLSGGWGGAMPAFALFVNSCSNPRSICLQNLTCLRPGHAGSLG